MLHYTHVRTAVIVATYDQPRWLDLALRAWARQELRSSFVVVADDGSGPETAEVVRRFGAQHVRREHEGARFGKCPAVNAAVRRARDLGCEFALFTDGDCLPAGGPLARGLRGADLWSRRRGRVRERTGRAQAPLRAPGASRPADRDRLAAPHSLEGRQLLRVPRRRAARQRL